MSEPTVYVVDDEPAIRHSLELLLRSVGLPAEAFPSGTAFLDAYSPELDGCLIADVRMPGMSGLELQEALAARGATLPVIIITGHGDISMAVRAMKAGATDFIEKPFNEQVLLDAVHRALARRTQTDAVGAGRAEIDAHVAALTPREKEVLLLVAEGRPNKVVATRLGLSTRTVEVHRAKVMEKMQARSLADLVRMAIICDLVQS